ncbi:hypothetical protein [Thermoflavimicrobium dichotomicum]|uniref:Uncharacterized protein n=1 Tax=Thermoflavimicrobium dichotomicum TaxID=46223 RepID=A0A1I3M0D1_9BACL|nr:hypothetical protein [Thermoflavimicrobium dichotomicum]SFI90136.1 hypothetical protein SAMN05421852_102386 [Thermoflavimicrobium dichotomicum]
MIEKIKQLEEQLQFFVSSGFQHTHQDLKELTHIAKEFAEAGFPQLAFNIQQIAEVDEKARLTHLFLLLRQLEWLKWEWFAFEREGSRQKEKRVASKWLLLPLSVMTWNDEKAVMCLLWDEKDDEKEQILIDATAFEGTLQSDVLKEVFHVEAIRFKRSIALQENLWLPVFQAQLVHHPENSILHVKWNEKRKMLWDTANGYFYLDKIAEDLFTNEFCQNHPIAQQNVQHAQKLEGYCFYYYLSLHHLPLFIVDQPDLFSARVLHLFERVWTAEAVEAFQLNKEKPLQPKG